MLRFPAPTAARPTLESFRVHRLPQIWPTHSDFDQTGASSVEHPKFAQNHHKLGRSGPSLVVSAPVLVESIPSLLEHAPNLLEAALVLAEMVQCC